MKRSVKKRSRHSNPRAADKPSVDPSVEELAKLIEEDGLSDSDIYENSYLSRSTIQRLTRQVTRRPMGLTIRGIAGAAGYDLVFQKRKRGK